MKNSVNCNLNIKKRNPWLIMDGKVIESDSIDDVIVYDEDSLGATSSERPEGEKGAEAAEKCIVANVVSMYQCQECNAVVSTAEEFLSHHQIMHSGSREVMVEFLKESDAQEPDSDVDVKYVCSLCYGVFESVEHTKQHMMQDHKLKEIGAKEDPVSSNPSSDSNEEKTETESGGKEQWKPISLKQLKTKLTRNLTHK